MACAFQSRFSIGDCVHIDRDNSITATVCAVLFRSAVVLCELSWINNGNQVTANVEEWRLSLDEDATAKMGPVICERMYREPGHAHR